MDGIAAVIRTIVLIGVVVFCSLGVKYAKLLNDCENSLLLRNDRCVVVAVPVVAPAASGEEG